VTGAGYTLILDCDGVLADTERHGHLPAFNAAFAELGVPMRWSEEDYADLVRIGGGKERIAAALAEPRHAGLFGPAGPPDDLVPRIHKVKTAIYRSLVADGVMPARTGVARLIGSALSEGWQVAVASTSAPESVRSVLDVVVGQRLAEDIPIFAGDAVPAKKPAPDIYLLALDRLDALADTTIVVEDSAAGMRAAVSAGLACIVTPSSYTTEEDFTPAAAVVTSLGDTDHPTTVVSDPHHVGFGDVVDTEALQRLLALRRQPLSSTHREPQ
jgi:HAD superfamily hydrolase (TIGR01509 family)